MTGQSSRRKVSNVLGLTLSELAFVMIYVFLLVGAVGATQLRETQGQLGELRQYRDEVQGVLDSLGVDIKELRQASTRLVPAEFLEPEEKGILAYIDHLEEENERLRKLLPDADEEEEGQGLEARLAELESQLKELRGKEPGSCWENRAGEIQFLFDIELRDEELVVEPAWPIHRFEEVRALGLERDASWLGRIANAEFANRSLPVYEATTEKNCRLFVRVRDSTTTKARYKAQRRLVERFYFVKEVLP